MSLAKTTTHEHCTLCRRSLQPGAHIVQGLGPVGPECVRHIAGLERLLEWVADIRGHVGNPQFANVLKELRAMGFRHRLEAVKTDDGRILQRIVVTGLRRSGRNAYGKTYAQERAEYARHLQQRAELRRAA